MAPPTPGPPTGGCLEQEKGEDIEGLLSISGAPRPSLKSRET